MKLVKELPKSIYYSLLLRLKSLKSLTKHKEHIPVIVSLTSIPSRLDSLHLVIKSLYNQTVLPKKIILWLNESLKESVPKSLDQLQSDIFQIKFSHLTCSHKKLIHSLKEQSSEVILTCDDDLIYDKGFLKNIYEEHLIYPNEIIANRTVQIKINKLGEYLAYKEWRKKEKLINDKIFLGIGAWGILYPPNCMSEIVFNEELFLKLTPKADDLWFKGMSLLKGTLTRQSNKITKEPIPIIGSQKVSLKKENVDNNKNDLQWKKLSNHFNLKELIFSK